MTTGTTLARAAGTLLLPLLLTLPGVASATARLTISDIAFTSALAEPVDGEQGHDPAGRIEPGRRDDALILWIKVRGDREALEALRNRGSLSVVVRWSYRHYGNQVERIDISVGRDAPPDGETLARLEREVEERGYFDWRTWARKEHLSRGPHEVAVVDGFDEPLACAAPAACTFHFSIR